MTPLSDKATRTSIIPPIEQADSFREHLSCFKYGKHYSDLLHCQKDHIEKWIREAFEPDIAHLIRDKS